MVYTIPGLYRFAVGIILSFSYDNQKNISKSSRMPTRQDVKISQLGTELDHKTVVSIL